MIAVPSGSAPRGWSPDDDTGDEDTDVLSLAGQPVPDGGAWLWVTSAEPRRGGELTALVLPRHDPTALGGEVLVRVSPSAGPDGGVPTARVQVWAVVAGSLVRVAAWDHAGLGQWPETVRDTVLFAVGALRELQEHGADIGLRDAVPVAQAAESVPTGFPALPTWVSAAR